MGMKTMSERFFIWECTCGAHAKKVNPSRWRCKKCARSHMVTQHEGWQTKDHECNVLEVFDRAPLGGKE